jgi:cell division septal protein FtsQ
MTWSRKRWLRRLGFVAALLTVGVAWAYAPDALREVELFRVQQVEVVGTRFLEPYTVVRAAGLDSRSSIFDDAAAWSAGVRTLPMVEEVRIHRIYPSKVLLEVRESEPVALVAGPTLRPVDADGRLLELDPAGAALDLPIATGVHLDGGRVAEGASAAAIRTIAALLSGFPDVAEQLSQVELNAGDLRLTFRGEAPVALISAAATPLELRQLKLALADLSARGELGKARMIDVRFRDQVVVSFPDKS